MVSKNEKTKKKYEGNLRKPSKSSTGRLNLALGKKLPWSSLWLASAPDRTYCGLKGLLCDTSPCLLNLGFTYLRLQNVPMI